MAKKADDLRRHPRVEARLAMQLAEESLGDALVTTESLNISRGGVYCESAEFLAPLSRVALTVVLPPFGAAGRSRVLKSEGVVVRCENMPPLRGRKRYQLACCFTGRRDLQTDCTTLASMSARRCAANLSGMPPPSISTPASMFFSIAYPVRFALVMKHTVPSATATLAWTLPSTNGSAFSRQA